MKNIKYVLMENGENNEKNRFLGRWFTSEKEIIHKRYACKMNNRVYSILNQ